VGQVFYPILVELAPLEKRMVEAEARLLRLVELLAQQA
jgi:hypothetical protein